MRVVKKKVLPPLFMLICGLLMWVISHGGGEVQIPYARGVSLTFLILGICLDIGSVYSLWRARTTVNPFKPESSTTLVKTRLFRFSRNPIYLGYFFILVGWGLFLSAPWTLLILPFYVVYMNIFQILPEEDALRELFKEDYEVYCSRVRRWI